VDDRRLEEQAIGIDSGKGEHRVEAHMYAIPAAVPDNRRSPMVLPDCRNIPS
jgi:hypothetical protein